MENTYEAGYRNGSRLTYILMLQYCLRHLEIDDPEAAYVKWIAEREFAISELRSLCADFGDNDWPDNLFLADIIQKHLGRDLYETRDLRRVS